MSAAEHKEPAPVNRGDIGQALKVAAALRNVYSIEEGEGETPVIVELGKPWGPGEDGATVRYLLQDKSEWRFEVHVGCGEMCPVLAVVPYDSDSDGPHRDIAEAIAQAGEVILGLTERIASLEAEASQLRALLSTPLRLGRGPTVEEFRAHAATGGGWMLQGVGEDLGGWAMEMRPIPDADIPAMVRFTKDAIPLSPSRQPCRVGDK